MCSICKKGTGNIDINIPGDTLRGENVYYQIDKLRAGAEDYRITILQKEIECYACYKTVDRFTGEFIRNDKIQSLQVERFFCRDCKAVVKKIIKDEVTE